MPKVAEEYLKERRREIVRAAATCFAERGFRATHMREVARRAGLSTGSVYRYFPGKEALFKAVLDSDRPEDDAHTARYLEGATPIERLRGLVTRLAERTPTIREQIRKNFRDYGEASQVPFLEEELRHHVARIVGRVASIVRDAQRTGYIDPELDPRAVAALLVSQTVSLGFLELFDDEYDGSATKEGLRRMLDGLGPRTGT